MKTPAIPVIAMLLLAPCGAFAEVTSVGPSGFSVAHSRAVTVRPAGTWSVMTGKLSQWWDGSHSWSGDASNLYLEARQGGCMCEHLPNGGWVEHLRVIYLAPSSELRFRGALGPLMQLGLEGTMTWTVKPGEDGGSVIAWQYVVHGHRDSGFADLASAVDGVLGTQLERLATLLESD